VSDDGASGTAATGFADRYGPWALVAGASEGVGLAYAEAMAERGLNVALVARRQSVLDDVAAHIRDRFGVQTRALAIDLSDDEAAGRIADATTDIDVGMLMYCAGADPNFENFLDGPIEAADAMVRRNCVTPLRLCHHLARPMVGRGRGGIVLVSSGAALVGARRMVAYASSKAFDLVMGEALWAELHGSGVHVLALVLGVTDTPALRRLLAERGNLTSADDGTPIPGAATPDEVVRDALAHLGRGPTWFVGEMLREGSKHLGAMDRNDAVRLMLEVGAGVMDQKLS
jgi:short-subunit dehydrogenase